MSNRIPEYPIPGELEKALLKKSKPSQATQKYTKILDVLKTVKSIDISEEHYLQLLKLSLYLEELQNNIDMKKHEIIQTKITKLKSVRLDPSSFFFRITVDDLDEGKPWIRPNDSVDVIDIKDSKMLYTMRVTYVSKVDIIACDEDASLCNHTPDTLYNIKFRFQNYPIRCAHYALRLMSEKDTVRYLFPCRTKSYVESEDDESDNLHWYNKNIENNPEQKQAVVNIINKSSFPYPYILYGPPGTGKTATLVEAMCQISRNSRYNYILVCTPANTAADEIVRRLLRFLPSAWLYRMYSQSHDVSTVDKLILDCSNIENNKIVLATTSEIANKRIVISTLCNSAKLITMGLGSHHFSHVIIDEAGQGIEPDILIPISLISQYGDLHAQIVLAGDPQQLGPTVMSKIAEKIIGRSILERLMSYDIYQKGSDKKYNAKFITKLLINYRSHPAIIHISNKLFYDAELIAKHPRTLINGKFPVIFHGTKGKETRYQNSQSICNHVEIDKIFEYIDDLLKNRLGFGYVSANDIGIVTPFTLQSRIIKKQLQQKKLQDINVGTVELFQGQERKVIIMSTVRTRSYYHDGKIHLGHLSHYKRFNVALTRAKMLLIVIGDPTILKFDSKWHFFMRFCMDNKSYKGVRFVIHSESSIRNDKENDSPNLVKSTSLFKTGDCVRRNTVYSYGLSSDESEDEDIVDLIKDLKIDN